MVIKAVFFDLYETLITEWEEGKKKAAYSTESLGLDKNIFKIEWDLRRERRMNGTFPDHQSVLSDILRSQGIKPNLEAIDHVHEERLIVKTIPFQEMDPHVLGLLRTLRTKGLKLGLISNAAAEEVHAWEMCELADYFDEVVFSYEARVAKPQKEIYQMACEKLGVTPQESVFIGDGGSDELRGATEAGMTALQAIWFLPPMISDRITGYPKLKKPQDLLEHEDIKSCTIA
ncbi:HAD-IA family hydrolase [Fictibacillus sp. 7GRE50]|uniref:HAD family hydrolase n=1 Tax=unclassified Fictibacillus TaxID=2644029 RepID=UPI0018CE02E6|nr:MULTISPECIES: HAD-IA family hydrolase [unclassified Fictibacillus]MBH0164999.1 HAD-IA family hydrolase [Fictibacillus sp. 7GRE50]